MESTNSLKTLQELSFRLLKFTDLCLFNLKREFPREEIQALYEKIRRGPCLNVAAYGPTNSGKSFLLNFLLAADTNNQRPKSSNIFLSEFAAETYSPWFFTESRELSLDSIQVSHITPEGEETDRQIFQKDEFDEFTKYLKSKYARTVVDIQEGQLKPYNQINITYGIPRGETSQRLYTPLFETGLNVVDLQGYTEADSETTFKNLEKPFTLICTFDCSTGFFDKSEYTLLKDEISKFKPAHVIFVATKLDNAIRDIQRSQLEFDERDIPLDVPEIIEKIKAPMENRLMKDFDKNFYDLFLFDPWSDYSEIKFGVRAIRKKLIQVRNELNLEERFCKEMNLLLSKNIRQLNDELIIISLQEINPDFKNKLENREDKLQLAYKELTNKLSETLEKSFRENFGEKLKELANEKKLFFMQDKPIKSKLCKKLNQWFLDDGLKIVISQILMEGVKEFELENAKEIQEIFKFVMTESQIPNNLEIPVLNIPKLAAAIFSTAAIYSLRFITMPSLISILAAVGLEIIGGLIFGFVGILGLVISGLNAYIDSKEPADFEIVLEKWSNMLMSQLHDETVRSDLCKEAANQFIKAWKKENRAELNRFYVKTFVKDIREVEKKLQLYCINLCNLDKINEEVISLWENLRNKERKVC